MLISKKDNNLKLFQNDIKISLNLKEVYLDNLYLINDLNGNLNIKNNEIYVANISGDFDNVNNLKFTVNTNDVGEKISIRGFWQTKEESIFVSDVIEKLLIEKKSLKEIAGTWLSRFGIYGLKFIRQY